MSFMSTSLNAQFKSDHRNGVEHVVNVILMRTGMDRITISETWTFCHTKNVKMASDDIMFAIANQST